MFSLKHVTPLEAVHGYSCVCHGGVTYLYNVSWLSPMQISSGGIGNGLYQQGGGRQGEPRRASRLENNPDSPNKRGLTIFHTKYHLYAVVYWISVRYHPAVRSCVPLLTVNTPPLKAAVSERMVATVILFARPVFFFFSWREEVGKKGCDCDDGAAAEERGCNVLPECRILQKLHFAACQLRWQ